MKKPTIEEVLKLVEFDRWDDGGLVVSNVKGTVLGSVKGSVKGNVLGNVLGNVDGSVVGNVYGTINGREWQFIETLKEQVIRLIREGRGEEAIKILEESHL